MNQRSLAALIALNVVLLAALAVTVLSPQPAAAQPRTRPGEYLMISGSSPGRQQQDLIYILELKTTRMAVLIYNSANDSITELDKITVGEDIAP